MYTPSRSFSPVSFTPYYVPCQFASLLNLRPLIFRPTPFGWLRSITLIPYIFVGIFLKYAHSIYALFQEGK